MVFHDFRGIKVNQFAEIRLILETKLGDNPLKVNVEASSMSRILESLKLED